MGKGFDPRKPNRQDYYNLLNRALQIIKREKDAKEQQRAVERLLEENLDKLDDKFSQILQSWAMVKLSVVEPEEARRIARNLNNFCNWIAQFPLLKPENKWKIVITGWEVAATVLTREASPKEWLTIQNSLGIAYRNQGRIDEAIAIFKAALYIYPPEVFSKRFPDESARTQLNQLQQQIDELQEQLNSLITKQIQPHDPSFTLTPQVKGILFQEIQALLSDNKTALIEWYILDNIFVAFIITHQSPGITVWQSCPEDREDFKSWGEEYLQDYGQSSREAWQNHLESRLNRLAEILHLDEVLTHIPDTCDRVILVPHRSLHILPLHALPLLEEEDKCLLDKFPRGVKYAPSCQVLQLAQSRQRPDFTNLFAIQNPTENLDYSDIEVQVIKQHFHTSHILARGDAKKSAIDNQQLQAAHCVHFSCHGYFNFEHPVLSELNLADSHISLPKIFTLDLSQCRLVTLSACETGLTNFTSVSDEYIGLPNGFLVAGASSVVSSLWIVNEVCTALLMIQFYENLHDQQQQQGYLNVAIAINKAQTWLRDATKEQLQQWGKQLPNPNHRMQLRAFLRQKPPNSKPFESPYHWAAFCAIGQ
jgi:CHAT domain-containing protein